MNRIVQSLAVVFLSSILFADGISSMSARGYSGLYSMADTLITKDSQFSIYYGNMDKRVSVSLGMNTPLLEPLEFYFQIKGIGYFQTSYYFSEGRAYEFPVSGILNMELGLKLGITKNLALILDSGVPELGTGPEPLSIFLAAGLETLPGLNLYANLQVRWRSIIDMITSPGYFVSAATYYPSFGVDYSLIPGLDLMAEYKGLQWKPGGLITMPYLNFAVRWNAFDFMSLSAAIESTDSSLGFRQTLTNFGLIFYFKGSSTENELREIRNNKKYNIKMPKVIYK